MPNSNTLTNIVIGTVSGFVGGVLGVVGTLYVLGGEPQQIQTSNEPKPSKEIYTIQEVYSNKDLELKKKLEGLGFDYKPEPQTSDELLKEAIESGRWKKRPDFDESKF